MIVIANYILLDSGISNPFVYKLICIFTDYIIIYVVFKLTNATVKTLSYLFKSILGTSQNQLDCRIRTRGRSGRFKTLVYGQLLPPHSGF